VAGLERRLRVLEEAYGDAPQEEDSEEERIRGEVLSRMSVPEKRAYVAALRRALQAEGVFADEDRPIVERAEALYGEVRDELASNKA
jgi:hypothetical protein